MKLFTTVFLTSAAIAQEYVYDDPSATVDYYGEGDYYYYDDDEAGMAEGRRGGPNRKKRPNRNKKPVVTTTTTTTTTTSTTTTEFETTSFVYDTTTTEDLTTQQFVEPAVPASGQKNTYNAGYDTGSNNYGTQTGQNNGYNSGAQASNYNTGGATGAGTGYGNTGTSYGLTCWTCSATSFEDCEANGEARQCQDNEKSCFLEIRERREGRQFTQITTGCKATDACENEKSNNFNHDNPAYTQCRPETNYQESVCRQCCTDNNCVRDPSWWYPQSREEWAY